MAFTKQKMSGSIKVRLHCNKINESNTFTSGDIVEGKVVLEVTKEINVDSFFVKLTGDANVHWTEQTSFDETTYRDHDRYFKLKQYFIQESSKKGQERDATLVSGETYGPVIRAGSHVFPFRLQLPQQNMPASFKGYYGWVRYVLMGKLNRSWKPTSTTCGELTFLPRNDGTRDHLLQPQSATQDKKMKLFSSGKMSLTATTYKTTYAAGETITVFVDIDNSSSRDGKLKYSLIQQQMFLAGRTTKRKLRYIVNETKDCIPSGEKQKFIVNLKIPRDLTVTTKNCRIINVQYQLKVSLDVSFSSDPEVMFPVVILPADQQWCPPWQGPPRGFQPYPPPQPNLVPYPGGPPPSYAEVYPNLNDPSVLPYPGAAAGLYPNPNAMLPVFYPTPSAPVYDPNQSTKESSPNVPY
ncbi:arrestin domain-containing protein 3-like [Rhinichthys klamathensis goyatoka]|uniref:arrestin domain-containing protein 3-like n=1 Tax=Rhinichthys klamathensis goyatoka TaxID=3034132 RepID=UPI0024B62A20|nr:arrestin domain-containing protein 3-like [Rhinichthys klamathensis goyatoka]